MMSVDCKYTFNEGIPPYGGAVVGFDVYCVCGAVMLGPTGYQSATSIETLGRCIDGRLAGTAQYKSLFSDH